MKAEVGYRRQENSAFFKKRDRGKKSWYTQSQRTAAYQPPEKLLKLRLLLPTLPRVQCPGAAVVYTWENGGMPTVMVEKAPLLVRDARALGESAGYW